MSTVAIAPSDAGAIARWGVEPAGGRPRRLSPARLGIYGFLVISAAFFLVPLYVIDEVVDKIRDGSIVAFEYDPASASLKRIAGAGARV